MKVPMSQLPDTYAHLLRALELNRHHGTNPTLFKKSGGVLYVDLTELERIRESHAAQQAKAEEVYYQLIEEGRTDKDLAVELAGKTDMSVRGWQDFLKHRLFRTNMCNIIFPDKPSPRTIKFLEVFCDGTRTN